MKQVSLIFLLLFSSSSFFGQTLVHFGNKTISRQEFLTAFSKNNLHVKASTEAYREYLNLYINYRLKVQAAYDAKLDSLPGQITELQNFKSQIIDQYVVDETSLNLMAKEAFLRSQQDLRLSYIFVAAPKNASPADTAKAWLKIQTAYRELKNAKNFNETALAFSDDPYVKSNKGDLGFITVFDLPYMIETVAYKTSPGKYSPVFRTDGGYIILKKTAERPAWGRIRITQILVAFPFQASDAGKKEAQIRADSIYRAVSDGADFGEMARRFSGDNLSYQMGGVLPEFGIGKYESGFENTAYGLKKEGDISAPYASAFGYHILKLIAKEPVPKTSDPKILDALKERIKTDPRISVSRKQMMQTILKQTRFREFIPAGNRFWDYTDSLIQNRKPAANAGINDETVLFTFPDKKYLVGDWIVYRKSLRSAPQLTNGKTNTEVLDGYKQNIAFEYYKAHLELYNPEFAAQVNEFRDGNLLFEIMQREIWTRASADSAGLRKYFDAHVKDYWWKPGAEAILFNTNSASLAKKVQSELEGNIRVWKKLIDSLGSQVQADSGRFELKQIPGNPVPEAGRFTQPVTNPDKSIQFAYIIREYGSPSPRTFDEARGLALNDYQTELENKWVAEFKKKYPVVINETVFRSLPH